MCLIVKPVKAGERINSVPTANLRTHTANKSHLYAVAIDSELLDITDISISSARVGGYCVF